MSWIEKLYRTYENNNGSIGDGNDAIPLLPISHTTQNAHIAITIDGNGNFVRASVVPKTDARTIIPATEESAGRSGKKPAPYPLCDKLQYTAGDFSKYGGKVTSGFSKKPREPHEAYIQLLSNWCASSEKHPKVCAVLKYVQKGKLIKDLVDAGVLCVGKDGRFISSPPPDAGERPEIFNVLQGNAGQGEAFIRFSVVQPGDPQSALWSDSAVWNSWAAYYASQRTTKGFCFISGEPAFLAEQHPAKIRNPGDKAKLISSNDNSGFTFRGRFTTADEACGVGFEATQKAHSALRWLIARQGWRDGDQAVVAWAVSGVEIPDPLADTFSLLFDGQEEAKPQIGYTAQEVGVALSKRIAGYSAKLGATADVVVLGLDSATPGRMAIRFYRELTGSEFLDRVLAWHTGCCWLQKFGSNRVFIGAPSPRDIAEAAYGRRLDDKLRNATVERLLPCIIDGMRIPIDLVGSCVRRASNRQGFKEDWEWEKVLGIACALYSKYEEERRYSMGLERNRKTRDYLYGRLLALAEHLEGRALYVANEKRATNAERLMQRFADRPHSTWLNIEISLTPYKVRLRAKRPGFLHSVGKELDEVVNSFATDDFISDRRLTGEFLLSYHCQRADLWARPEQVEEADNLE